MSVEQDMHNLEHGKNQERMLLTRKYLMEDAKEGSGDMGNMGMDNMGMNNMGMDNMGSEWGWSKKSKYSFKGGVGMLLLWVVILFIIALIILWFAKPTYVFNPVTNTFDWGKACLAAFVFALVGVIIVWLIMSCV
jgi:hypothetical protein